MSEYQDINETRRRGMRLKVQEHGLDVVCEKLGVHKNQMRHWIGRTPSRNISDEVARKLERVLKLPRNWMDNPHPDEESAIEQMMSLPPKDFLAHALGKAVELGVAAALKHQTSQFEKIAALERRIMELERACPGFSNIAPQQKLEHDAKSSISTSQKST